MARPLVFPYPAGQRHQRLSPGANGYSSGHDVANVSLFISVDDICRWHIPIAQGKPKLLPVPGAVHLQYRRNNIARFQSCPAQRQRQCRGRGHAGQDWTMPRDANFLDHRSLATLNLDLLADHLCHFPFPLVLILVWVLRVKFLDVKVFYIGDGIGEAPGNMLIVTNDDAGHAWETDAGDINIGGDQMAFIPDRRSSLSLMRVITEDWRSRNRQATIDHPAIACAKHAKSAQLLDIFILLKHTEVDALVFDARRDNQRVPSSVAHLQSGSTLS